MFERVPLPKALGAIILSVFVISGGCFSAFKLYRYSLISKLKDSQYTITTLVQTGPTKEALNTQYIAELLGLSSDQPTHLYLFDERDGASKLMRSPLIAKAQIKKLKPRTLYVDYTLRQPYARIGDYENLALDKERNLFSLKPFFSPKQLPELYLGVHEKGEFELKRSFDLAMNVLASAKTIFHLARVNIKRVDVSRAFLQSYGQKEVVIVVEDRAHTKEKSATFTHLLRLNTIEYEKNLRQYFALRKELLKKQEEKMEDVIATIDLRLDNLAYIGEQ